MRSNIFSIRWLQISLGPTILSLLHLGIASLLVYVLSDIFLDHYYHPLGVFRYFMAEDFYLIWLMYLISFLMLRSGQLTSLEKPTTGIRSKIQVSSKNKMIQVPVTEINCIKSARPYLAISTTTEKYLYTSSLKEMLPQLDPTYFVRVHRSAILNLRHVVSFQSRANGDYDILLTNGHRIRLSRNYLKDFRLKMDRFTQGSL
ncbi:MAG: LytTR family transcriptional regulator [Saprospiraceae bacterium]|nr:LytTR family transcriptional regulator [Saprospiraceae bacterium]